jgi:hypothetical protein
VYCCQFSRSIFNVLNESVLTFRKSLIICTLILFQNPGVPCEGAPIDVFMQMIAHLRDRAVNCSKDRSDPAERNLKSEVIPIRAVTVAKSEKYLAGVAKSLMARPMNLAIEDMNMTGPAAKQGVENIGAVSESSYREEQPVCSFQRRLRL